MSERIIGVIGGSGLYEMPGFKLAREVSINTPFGKPSDKITLGELAGVKMAFLPRHGRGHFIIPSQINYRANIYALKKLGCEFIIASAACGSLSNQIHPGDIVIVDQFIDRTKHRIDSFFGNGIVAHTLFSDPVCQSLAQILYDTAFKLGLRVHRSGTYVCIEGPAFSTRAESYLYRKWNADVVGMTNLTEAKLAREAEICYATIALCTDYDCWKETEAPFTIEQILAIMHQNTDNWKKIIKSAVPHLPKTRTCACKDALKNAIITDPKKIPPKIKKDLKIIIGKYI